MRHSTAVDIDRLLLAERVLKDEAWAHKLEPGDVDGAVTLGEAHKGELNAMLHEVRPSGALVKVGTKKRASVESKLTRWKAQGKARGVDSMSDLTRGMIVTKTAEEAEAVAKQLAPHAVKYERKEAGEDREFGYYGSHHLDVRLKSGHVAEVQIMPQHLYDAKDELHDVYKAQRDKLKAGVDTPEMKRQRKASRVAFHIANGRKVPLMPGAKQAVASVASTLA